MACNCCRNGEALYVDKNNSAFIDSHGEMRITAGGNEIRFTVERCPRCGERLNVCYLNMRKGDDIWYADGAGNIIEHSTIDNVLIQGDKVDSFSVFFDNGDFSVFNGGALGTYFFLDIVSARDALVRSPEEYSSAQN